jgi:hypothetical protein
LFDVYCKFLRTCPTIPYRIGLGLIKGLLTAFRWLTSADGDNIGGDREHHPRRPFVSVDSQSGGGSGCPARSRASLWNALLPQRGKVGALVTETVHNRNEKHWRKFKGRPPQNSEQSEALIDWKRSIEDAKTNCGRIAKSKSEKSQRTLRK